MALKYKAGDKVRINSLGWYDENKDAYGYIECGKSSMNFETSQLCGKIVTISRINDATNTYRIEEDNGFYNWTDEMIEGLVEEETTSDKVVEEAKTYWDSIKDAWICPDGYIFKDENGNVINAQKIVLEKKKKEYPKTYEECAEIIAELTGSDCNPKGCMGYMFVQLTVFQKLLVCRDTYWKIAGWEPDWTTSEPKYVIAHTSRGIEKQWETTYCKVFAFPTEEIRDAFYEAFKDLIEQCKKLL